jgi:hypothetical protein
MSKGLQPFGITKCACIGIQKNHHVVSSSPCVGLLDWRTELTIVYFVVAYVEIMALHVLVVLLLLSRRI